MVWYRARDGRVVRRDAQRDTLLSNRAYRGQTGEAAGCSLRDALFAPVARPARSRPKAHSAQRKIFLPFRTLPFKTL